MSTGPHRETAKILAFTPKMRIPAGDSLQSTGSVADIRPKPLRHAPSGSGWYHEAAMLEEEPNRKP